jgi:hypothetical protein
MVQSLPGAKIVDTEAAAGGGSLPGLTIPSLGIALTLDDVDTALARLRARRIVALARDGAVVADVRSVDPSDDARLVDAFGELLATP